MLSDAHCHLDGSQSLALLQQEHDFDDHRIVIHSRMEGKQTACK